MKKTFTILLLLNIFVGFSQQTFQGKAVYMSKTTMDMSRFGDKMSEQRKKQMMERMKNFLEKTYTLSFDRVASSFKENEKLDAPGSNSRGRMWGGSSEGSTYKNLKDKEIIEDKEFFGKRFLITEKVDQPQWELTGDTKKIGNYTVYKATLVKENSEFNWRSMRRRNNEEKDSTKTDDKKLLITAWYTPEIPVSTGPANYWGLPGLILEVNSGRTTMLCTEVVLNPKEQVEITKPTKGKEISRKEYNEVVKKKMEEMRERFEGRSRRGRRF